MTGYVTTFSIRIVVFMIVTQPVVYVTTPAVTGCGNIQVCGVDPLNNHSAPIASWFHHCSEG
ncbi:hypothetical protein AV903_07515 [Erwinia tracheiphila]|uniref:Uncharacterized protein n=1 Tax=Erwinia tracheiphila TaxID=65700 RepID=A0A345CR69_9GAMM|nr:hypothetical protein AV903_07515 [Erwinia tracheiphila]